MNTFRVTRVGDKIAVNIFGKTRKVIHQGFITVNDIDRLMPLFDRYFNKAQVKELVSKIKEA